MRQRYILPACVTACESEAKDPIKLCPAFLSVAQRALAREQRKLAEENSWEDKIEAVSKTIADNNEAVGGREIGV